MSCGPIAQGVGWQLDFTKEKTPESGALKWRPKVKAQLTFNGKSVTDTFLVDSGADHGRITRSHAKTLGVDTEGLPASDIHKSDTAGGPINVSLHVVKIRILSPPLPREFSAKVELSLSDSATGTEIPLLGRAGLFENYDICFISSLEGKPPKICFCYPFLSGAPPEV
jgi:hypothetical protein